jgi:uncharacterized protein (TIGR03435 family)
MRTHLLTGLMAVCVAAAQSDAPPAFEAASVKPNHSGTHNSSTHTRPANVEMKNVTLRNIITSAYRIKDYQVSGPEWLRSERYDIVAKAPFGTPEAQIAPMLRTLLAERFKLETHSETKEFPVYGLVATKGGLIPQPAEAGEGSSMNTTIDDKGGELKAQRTTLARLAEWLSTRLDRPVLDMSGLTGAYDFNLKFSLENAGGDADTPKYPILPLALQEQLGLRLEKRTAPIEILVVDRAEKVPVEN